MQKCWARFPSNEGIKEGYSPYKPFKIDHNNLNMKYSALNVISTVEGLTPRFKESSVRMHQIWAPPSKRAVPATVLQSSTRTVADR